MGSYFLPSLSFNEERKLNQIKLKGVLKDVKSNYILKKIFYNLTKGKFLNIIKYNKKLKKKIEY